MSQILNNPKAQIFQNLKTEIETIAKRELKKRLIPFKIMSKEFENENKASIRVFVRNKSLDFILSYIKVNSSTFQFHLVVEYWKGCKNQILIGNDNPTLLSKKEFKHPKYVEKILVWEVESQNLPKTTSKIVEDAMNFLG